ncbi:hypothetical protein MTO96_035100 [Rhipicephalus appendiculatus]
MAEHRPQTFGLSWQDWPTGCDVLRASIYKPFVECRFYIAVRGSADPLPLSAAKVIVQNSVNFARILYDGCQGRLGYAIVPRNVGLFVFLMNFIQDGVFHIEGQRLSFGCG